jgi:hypothetical protein
MIQPPRLYAALDVGCELFAQDLILGADCAGRAQKQPGELHQVGKDLDNCSHGLKHARITPDPIYARSRSSTAKRAA